MEYRDILFNYYEDLVFDIYEKKRCPLDHLIFNGKWFTDPQGRYYKYLGNMIESREDENSNSFKPCINCQNGWLWNGIGVRYSLSYQNYSRCYFGDINHGFQTGFGFGSGYFGEFYEDMWTGVGCSTYKDYVYMGEFRSGCFHGKGTLLKYENNQLNATFCSFDVDELIKFGKSFTLSDYSIEYFSIMIERHVDMIYRKHSSCVVNNPRLIETTTPHHIFNQPQNSLA